jgi:hypothetical protein
MSILSRLFGGGSTPEPEPETYKDFRIFPAPQSDAGGYRIAGRIEKELDGEMKSQSFLRADICQSREEAENLSILKAKQIIDEQGDRMFG